MSIEKKPPKFEEAIFRLDGGETFLARDEITKLRMEEPEKFMRDVKLLSEKSIVIAKV